MTRKIRRDTLNRMVADYTSGEFDRKQLPGRRAWPQNVVQALNDTTKIVYAGGILRVEGFLYPNLNAEEAEELYRTDGPQVVGKEVTRFAHEIRVSFADCCEKDIVRPAWLPGVFGDYVYELKTIEDSCPGGEYHRFVRYDTEHAEYVPALDDASYLAEYRDDVTRPYRLVGSHGGPWEIVATSAPSTACGERRHFCLLRPAWTDVRIGVIANNNGFATDDMSNVWAYSPLKGQNNALAEVVLNGDTQHPFFCFSPLQAYNTKIPQGIRVAIAVDHACGQTNIISAECF